MIKKRILMLIFLGVILFTLTAFSSEESFDLSLMIEDEAGNQIIADRITISNDDYEQTFENKSILEINIPEGTYTIEMEKLGYELITKTVELDEDKTVIINNPDENFDWITILEELYNLDTQRPVDELANQLSEELENGFELAVETNTDEEANMKSIDYSIEVENDRVLRLLILAGLPTEKFSVAEREYRQEVIDTGSNFRYILTGSDLGGALAQYAGVISEGMANYNVITFNPVGIENLLEFRGNEFLGAGMGLMYFLDDVIRDRGNSDMVLSALKDNGIIANGNISYEYRDAFGEDILVDEMEETLVEVFEEMLALSTEGARQLVGEHFDYEIVERKMRLITRYQNYENNLSVSEDDKTSSEKNKDTSDKINNYITFLDVETDLLESIGTTYVLKARHNENVELRSEEILEQFEESDFDILR